MAESQIKASTGPRSPTGHNSSPELRNRAKATVSQLHSHGIGFSQLLEEGVDEDLLRTFYAELGFPVPRRTALKEADDLTSNDHSSPSHIASKDQVPDSEWSYSVKQTPLNRRDPSMNPSAEVAATSAPPPNLSQPTRDSDNGGAIVKRHSPLKDVVNIHKTKPGTASILPRFSGSNASNKSVAAKTQGDTLERKDYIARMLAAKAGKFLPVKPPSPVPVTMNMQESDVADKQQTNSENVPSSTSTNQDAPVSSITPDADMEAKKRAQTELARQKMEALMNRGTGQLVEPRKPNKQASAVGPQIHPLESIHQVPSKSQADLPVATEFQPPIPPRGLSPTPSVPWTAANDLSKTRSFGTFPPTPSSGIPGLFMTTSTAFPLSSSDESVPRVREQMNAEAFPLQILSMTGSPPSQPTAPADLHRSDGISPKLTHAESKATSLTVTNDPEKSRKRAKAADFIEAPAAKFRKAFGSSRLIIEVSEDEANETSDVDADDHLMDLEEDARAGQNKNTPEVSIAIPKQKLIRNLAPLSDFSSAKKPMLGSGVDTPPAVQTPGKGKEQEDLRRKEEQIELMNRKIAEMEQRRKAKQTASRAHTPGTPARSGNTPSPETSLAEASKQSQAVTDVVRMIDENTGELEAQKTRLAAAEASMKEKLNIEQEARLAEVAKAEHERIAGVNAATLAELNQRRRRRAEIESGLPKLDAEVERTKTKLDILKKQMEELESELQIGLQGRKTLMQELEHLSMVIQDPIPAEPPVFPSEDNQLQRTNSIPVDQG